MAEDFSFSLANIPIEAEYRKLKTMRLTVYPDGRVKIAAPSGTAPSAVIKFAATKLEWIEKQRKKFLDNSAGTKPGSRPGAGDTFRNHSVIYVWGVPHELVLVEHSGNSKIIVSGNIIKMYSRPNSPKSKKQEILDRWRRRVLKEAAPEIINKWEMRIGVKVNKLYIRKMKSHWGSCNYEKQTLRLNSELTKRSPECLEYVIVHEMLHIIEKGHNRDFYNLLGKYIPDWKVIRKKMNNDRL